MNVGIHRFVADRKTGYRRLFEALLGPRAVVAVLGDLVLGVIAVPQALECPNREP